MSNINELVREDIRDSILNSKNEKEKEKEKEKPIKDLNITNNNNENLLNGKHKDLKIQLSSHHSSSSSLSNLGNKKNNSKLNTLNISKINKKKGNKEKNLFLKKKKTIKQKTKSSFDSTKIDLNAFRPPNIWNYPLYKLKKLKYDKNEIIFNEIRDVDPTKCYVDGRIQKFNKMFDNLYNNMIQYWNTGKKADTWDYFYDKVLKALKIKYVTNKVLKREEERKRQIEEEEKRKKEEEEKEINKKIELMNKEISKTEKTNDLSNMIYNSESTLNNNMTTSNNMEEDKKIENKISIKKIKIIKSKDGKLFKTKINIKDEGVTNETTT